MAARASRTRIVLMCALGLCLPVPALAQDSPMVRLLKGGKVPDERQGMVLSMIAQRGTAADLRYIFDRAQQADGFAPEVRAKALAALCAASENRKLRPEGDLTGIGELVEDQELNISLRESAVQLAGLWEQHGLERALGTLAAGAGTPRALRVRAMEALARLGARGAIEELARPENPPPVRFAAVGALARLDTAAAAPIAVELLAANEDVESVREMLSAFLSRQDGARALAEAFRSHPLKPDAARRALRAMYVLGRSDASLVAVLSAAAGIDAEVKPLDEAQMKLMVAEVLERGNATKGEDVFRRLDLNCSGCHAIGGAGGNVGPDLGPLGSTSPPDYIVRSIMQPDESIKEQYQTLMVSTVDGQILQGIVADRDDQRVVLKQADGSTRAVAVADIDEQKTGGSLMPKGLPNLITHAEFVDLVRFLSELGKPGPYAIKSTPTLVRWSVFKDLPDALAIPLSGGAALPTTIGAAANQVWGGLLATATGDVTLSEAREISKSKIIFMRSFIDASTAGSVRLELESSEGVMLWVGGVQKSLAGNAADVDLEAGRNMVVLRVDLSKRESGTIRAEVARIPGSKAAFVVDSGPR